MGLRLWSLWNVRVVGPVKALHRWMSRPVTNPQPIIGGTRVTRGANTYGRHDRSVGTDTVPLGELLKRMGFEPPPRRREPRLFGTDPLPEWTHEHRYGKPTPPPASAVTALFSPDFDDTEVMA